MRAILRVLEWKFPRHSRKLLIERGVQFLFTKSFILEISKKLRYSLFETFRAKKNNFVCLTYLNLNAMPTSPGGSFPLTTPSNSFTRILTCFCYNLRRIWKIDEINFHAVNTESKLRWFFVFFELSPLNFYQNESKMLSVWTDAERKSHLKSLRRFSCVVDLINDEKLIGVWVAFEFLIHRNKEKVFVERWWEIFWCCWI